MGLSVLGVGTLAEAMDYPRDCVVDIYQRDKLRLETALSMLRVS